VSRVDPESPESESPRIPRILAGTPNTDVTEYEWDHRNRLTTVTHYAAEGGPAGQIVEYTYDFGNRWVRKVLDTNGDGNPEGSTIFVYDGTESSPRPLAGEGLGVRASQIALQFDKTGSGDADTGDLSHRYLWGPAVDQILADEQVDSLTTPGNVLWPLSDHLGTVRDLAQYDAQTDTTTIANHRTYDAFGRLTSETAPTVDHLFAFTGRPFDEDTGLQNNLNRWYDPSVGRWLSEDPIGFRGGDVNVYRYVRNTPQVAIDPTGQTTIVPILPPLGSRDDLQGSNYVIDAVTGAKAILDAENAWGHPNIPGCTGAWGKVKKAAQQKSITTRSGIWGAGTGGTCNTIHTQHNRFYKSDDAGSIALFVHNLDPGEYEVAYWYSASITTNLPSAGGGASKGGSAMSTVLTYDHKPGNVPETPSRQEGIAKRGRPVAGVGLARVVVTPATKNKLIQVATITVTMTHSSQGAWGGLLSDRWKRTSQKATLRLLTIDKVLEPEKAMGPLERVPSEAKPWWRVWWEDYQKSFGPKYIRVH